MFTHYGCLTDRWFPANSHGPLTTNDLDGTSLDVLAPHVGKLLMPRGIRAMNQWTSGLDLGQGNDPHTQVVGTYFTGVPVTPNSDDPFSLDAETKFLAMPTARSLDHVCAEQLSPGGVPLYLRVAGTTETPQSCVSYSAGETPFAGIGTFSEAFSAITGLFSSGSAADSYRLARGQSVVDLIRTDLEAFERFDMSAADRQKIEAWKALLDDTGTAVVSAHCSAESAATLALTPENFATVEAAEDRVAGEVAPGVDGANLFSNIAVLAALCDHSRVILLKYPTNYVFRGLGITTENHALSHRLVTAAPTSSCLTSVNDLLQTLDRFYAAKFAHLVATLDSFDEGNGTLLDNSATVWFQEMSDGNAHNLNNMPLLQAGSCGGYFKTGVAVNVDDGSSSLHRGNSLGVCDSPEVVDTCTPVEFANAPINKYFCNLMNAIGVKAGPDGFPALGGTAEITHWGMYDETRDFVGGGVNPPRINDPGEFSELRANG